MITAQALLAFRLAALHTRLCDAEERRIARTFHG
jgi:hypothetical protein